MSSSNENTTPKNINDSVTINENGEVVIKDAELAKMSEELTPEELEAVAGGLARLQRGDNFGCNSGC